MHVFIYTALRIILFLSQPSNVRLHGRRARRDEIQICRTSTSE